MSLEALLCFDSLAFFIFGLWRLIRSPSTAVLDQAMAWVARRNQGGRKGGPEQQKEMHF